MMGKHPGSFQGQTLGMRSGLIWGGGRQPLPAAPSPDRKQAWDQSRLWLPGLSGKHPRAGERKGGKQPFIFTELHMCTPSCHVFPVKTMPHHVSTGHVDTLFLKAPTGLILLFLFIAVH